MKVRLLLLALILSSCSHFERKAADKEVVAVDFYYGMWALDLEYEGNNTGWLEVRNDDGYLDADLLWRWGSVTPVEFVYCNEYSLSLTQGHDIIRKKDTEGKALRSMHKTSWFIISKTAENEIKGKAFFPADDGLSVESVSFKGKRIPELEGAPDLAQAERSEAINLFNGSDLTGWEILEKGAVNGWKAEEGVLVNDPVQKEGEAHIYYGNLRSTESYDDFNLKLEVSVPAGSNSGVYLKGIYEIQVSDSYGKPLDSHNMGALYSRITPAVGAEKAAEEWQTLDITLYKRYLTVILNGICIIDNKPVKGITGGAMRSDEFVPGPIYLQGDHGAVSYRNIVLTPLK